MTDEDRAASARRISIIDGPWWDSEEDHCYYQKVVADGTFNVSYSQGFADNQAAEQAMGEDRLRWSNTKPEGP